LNALWALEIIYGMDIHLRQHQQFSNWAGQTSSQKKQNSPCFSREKEILSMMVCEIFQTSFFFEYFTVHTPDGNEADRCNKDDATVKLETASGCNGSQTTQYNVCSRRLSVMCRRGRRAHRPGYDRHYEEFIDSKDPPNMIVVFEDSNHDESVLKLPIYTNPREE
jgi:hypothetical protein